MKYLQVRHSGNDIFLSTILVLSAIGKIQWRYFWIAMAFDILSRFCFYDMAKKEE